MNLTLGILKTTSDFSKINEVLEGIQDNLEYFNQIIYTGNREDLKNAEFDFVALELDTDNKAVLRNKIIDKAENELILWIDNATVLEFDMIPEMMEVLESNPDADIIYTNIVYRDIDGNESIRKLEDVYGKEKNLLMTLKIEDYIPEFGVITKKDSLERLGKFDESFKDYEFYKFIYENLNNLKLKLSEFNYVVKYLLETFIDTSYRSKALRDALKKYPLQEFFPKLGWNKNENLALATAYTSVGDVLSDYYDLYNASEFYRKAALSFHNKITLSKLVQAYLNMGLFDEAKKLVSEEQGFSQEEVENLQENIGQIQRLIEMIEQSINEGNVQEIFNLINEIASVYQGAPLYNILGALEYYANNLEKAYQFFYKAATLNPLNEDIIHNLTGLANQLGKQEDVKGLFERLLG